jgi:hypothetical protein
MKHIPVFVSRIFWRSSTRHSAAISAGPALANYVVATGSNGYKAVLALGEIDPSFHPGEVIVADSMEGKPLDAHSGPLKLVVTEDKRPARSVRNLVKYRAQISSIDWLLFELRRNFYPAVFVAAFALLREMKLLSRLVQAERG